MQSPSDQVRFCSACGAIYGVYQTDGCWRCNNHSSEVAEARVAWKLAEIWESAKRMRRDQGRIGAQILANLAAKPTPPKQ